MVSIEYFIGAFIGIIFVMLVRNKNRVKISSQDFKIKYSQSHIFEIIKPLLPPIETKKINKNTQSYKHEEKTNVKVIIMDGSAFWIRDNVFYTAEFDNEGIDKDSTSVVDIMSMDKVQLNKMLFIMDQLRDGKDDDSRSSGDQ